MAKNTSNIHKCPQCGSKNIDVEVFGDELTIIFCDDCEETTEIKAKGAKKKGSRREEAHEDDDDVETGWEDDEVAEYADDDEGDYDGDDEWRDN